MPVPPGMLLGGSDALPSWAVLQATGDRAGPPFKLVDAGVPFEASLGDAVTLADPRGPRTGDLNGDGAQDVILPLGGVFNVFQNLSADQDLLVAVSDGMNAHEPTEPGFVPNVSISYGHLTDASVTSGGAEEDPDRRSALYLARSGAADDCGYPRRCVVGPRRVVSAYALNNGADRAAALRGRLPRRALPPAGPRISRVRRADRHRSGYGRRDDRRLRPRHLRRRAPGLSLRGAASSGRGAGLRGCRASPGRSRSSSRSVDVTRTLVPTNDGATYFTLPTERRMRRAQGVYPPPSGERALDRGVRAAGRARRRRRDAAARLGVEGDGLRRRSATCAPRRSRRAAST